MVESALMSITGEIGPILASGPDSRLIDSLFQKAKYRSLHRTAPLLQERELFLSHMLDRGVCKKLVQTTASLLLHAVRIMELEQMRIVGEAEEIGRASCRERV